jgi:tetratricopeptide (TPR) repeat protein
MIREDHRPRLPPSRSRIIGAEAKPQLRCAVGAPRLVPIGFFALVAWLAWASSVSADPIVLGGTTAPFEIFELHKGPQRPAEIDEAIKSFRQQRYDEALKHLQAAAAKRNELPPARLMLAELFFSSNQPAVARAVLEQAAAEHPQHPVVYLVSARQALLEGRRADALVLYEKAAALADAKTWSDNQRRSFLIACRAGRASVAEQRKDWPAAKTAFAELLQLDPKNGPARERFARAIFFLNQHEEAHAQLQQAAKDDPSLKGAEINLGLLFLEKGDLEKAVKSMQLAVKQAPNDPRAHLELGNCLLQQGQLAQAKACADAAAKLDPDAKPLRVLRGLIALASKDFEEAERQYQALLQESPEDSLARDKLALALVEQPSEAKHRRALELATMNVRLYPNAAWPLSTAGWVYYRLGRVEEAERALRAAISGPSTKPDTAYYLARMLSDQGRKEEARQLLELALQAPRGDFTFRQDAEKQLQQLTKTAP